MATVSALFCYPVKGFAGVSLQRADLVATGVRHDRQFMVVDAEDGAFMSQRVLARMAVVKVAVLDDGARLVLSAPASDDFDLAVAMDGPRRDVSLHKHWFGPAIDQGDPAAKWCSVVLGREVRLVRTTPDHDRDGWGEHPGKVGFADAHAVEITAVSTLDGLNDRITANGGAPVPMDRFRPNVVVSGWPEPHTEDRVRRMTAGAVELGYSAKAIRCVVPTVDQLTGERAGPEPTRTLATYRREPERGGGVSFGVKAAVLRDGVVSVGDEVTVGEWG